VDLSESDALWAIYMDKGGFEKSAYYNNFDIDGHPSIFSTRSLDRRAPRAKSILPIFSAAAIREASPIITRCAERMVEKIRSASHSGKPVDILNMTRAFALDSVTAYVFQQDYGGLSEEGDGLSVSPCVDAFVAVGRFYYLSHALFNFVEKAWDFIAPDDETRGSIALVDVFLKSLVERSSSKGSSYPSRLLANGAPVDETVAQCKDVLFAGTDSTGNNLATMCWFLTRHPEK
jgi:cytochrome P450